MLLFQPNNKEDRLRLNSKFFYEARKSLRHAIFSNLGAPISGGRGELNCNLWVEHNRVFARILVVFPPFFFGRFLLSPFTWSFHIVDLNYVSASLLEREISLLHE